MKKAKLDFWVDVAIGIAGLGSAITGLILLLPADLSAGILGISLRAWSSMHTWCSLAALVGVGVHLALHWRWLTSMARQMRPAMSPRQVTAAGLGATGAQAEGPPMSRRAFLALGGIVAVGAGLVAAGYQVLVHAASPDSLYSGTNTDDSPFGGSNTDTAQASGVACPRGLVNDPYPGQCRHYVDSNGDGICDYSVLGSGSSLSGNDVTGPGRPPRRHGAWGQP